MQRSKGRINNRCNRLDKKVSPMIKIKNTAAIALLLLFLQPNWTFGQANPDVGAEVWLQSQLKYKLSKNFEMGLGEQIRGSDNPIFNQNIIEINANYYIRPMLWVTYEYRFGLDNDLYKEHIERYQRRAFSIVGKHKLKRITYYYRYQYQSRREYLRNTNKYLMEPYRYHRFRNKMKWNIKNWKLDPVFGFEYFFRSYNNPNDQFNKYRFSLSTAYKINANHALKFRYAYERESKAWNPKLSHIVAVGYQYKFKGKELKNEN